MLCLEARDSFHEQSIALLPQGGGNHEWSVNAERMHRLREHGLEVTTDEDCVSDTTIEAYLDHTE